MKLVNEETRQLLSQYPIRSQEEAGFRAKAIVKFFLPSGAWTWYVTEAEENKEYGYLFFGLVINGCGEGEFGYFTLKELEEVSVPLEVDHNGRIMTLGQVGIERDTCFQPTPLNKIANPYVKDYLKRFI